MLDIYIGADCLESYLALTDDDEVVDLTGATLAGKLRPSLQSETVIATLDCTVVDGPGGVLSVGLDAATTSNLLPGSGVWDLSITLAGVTFLLAAGAKYSIHKRASR